MQNNRLLGTFLPLGLGVGGMLLLVRVTLLDDSLFLPANLDIFVFLFGLSLTTFTAIIIISRELTTRLRHQSIERARTETFAEHLRFLRRLDHELKNPLTAFRAGLGSLTLTARDEQQRRILTTLEAEALRLSQLVTDLRKLSELQTLPLDPRAIAVHAFAQEVAEMERERITAQGRTFTIDLPSQPETLPSLIGDHDLLLLALHNLLDNAIKFTHSGDSITLQVTLEEESIAIHVQDTGIGIAAEDLPLIWEELYRGQHTNDIPGNGIGLSLVQAIVRRHYGEVDVISEPGQGTRITLRFPRT